MAGLQFEPLQQWHPGEVAVHRMLNVPMRAQNPTNYGFPQHYAFRVQASPLLAVGAMDPETGQPWTTVWGGEAGFAGRIAPGVLGMRSLVDRAHDPVARALFGHLPEGEPVLPPPGLGEGGGGDPLASAPAMSALSVDFDTRDRVKLAGRLVAGNMSAAPVSDEENDGAASAAPASSSVGEIQLAMEVRESLGNCPKYINRKTIRPHVPHPQLVSDTLPLPPEAVALLERADTLFLSSSNGQGAMDTNIRGGNPGLVRVARNDPISASDDDSGTVLVYPEFSGNRLYQTLGNLHMDPRVGVVVPDFATGDVLYVTGHASILTGAAAANVLPRSNVAIRIQVLAARFVRDSLPFRGDFVDYSPYNPPLRRLATELKQGPLPDGAEGASSVATARLTKREVLAPRVARFTFSLRRTGDQNKRKRATPLWVAGQHVTLDFGDELDAGYSHMRDDDPQSLNDDFVRTFTVSNAPIEAEGVDEGEEEMQITVKKHGPATGLLFRWNMRAPLEIPVMAFGGESKFRLPLPGGSEDMSSMSSFTPVFVAGGVGITPLLAQAGLVLRSHGGGGGKLAVLWSLRAEDLPLAADSFSRIPGLAQVTTLFVTAIVAGDEVTEEAVRRARKLGAEVQLRRMGRPDLRSPRGVEPGDKRKFYLCMAPEMLKATSGWLEGEDFVTESFEY